MPKITLDIPDIGDVEFSKNARAKSIKIHINGSRVKVTYPRYISRAIAKSYVVSKKSWINDHKTNAHIFHSGDLIGKQHKLLLVSTVSQKITSKVSNDTLRINIPNHLNQQDPQVQTKIKTKIEKILKTECENLITNRLKDMAFENNMDFKSVNYKKLTRRWGSCDSKHNIIFNIYLVQLPWDLIDYVIVHELAHTVELNHSQGFWSKVESILPDYKTSKKLLKDHSPEAYVF
jgi:predicted metal-dependent hydrolase